MSYTSCLYFLEGVLNHYSIIAGLNYALMHITNSFRLDPLYEIALFVLKIIFLIAIYSICSSIPSTIRNYKNKK